MRKESEPAVENYSEESYRTTDDCYHGCVLRGRDEYPVCGKKCTQQPFARFDRCCRTILLLTVVDFDVIMHVEPSQLIQDRLWH
ncbi:hypothetical protein TNCV_4137281 [Trichonephila clavipes]|nr:hypothetical protein TNCV_4137281 [Trichonephila clavipes]